MKKFNLKEALTRGIGFTVIYVVVKMWSSGDYSMKSFSSVVVGGLVGGLIFGLIMGWFTRNKSVDNTRN